MWPRIQRFWRKRLFRAHYRSDAVRPRSGLVQCETANTLVTLRRMSVSEPVGVTTNLMQYVPCFNGAWVASTYVGFLEYLRLEQKIGEVQRDDSCTQASTKGSKANPSQTSWASASSFLRPFASSVVTRLCISATLVYLAITWIIHIRHSGAQWAPCSSRTVMLPVARRNTACGTGPDHLTILTLEL